MPPISVLDLAPIPQGATPAEALRRTLDLAQALSRASKSSAESAWGLRGAAALIGIALSLNGPGSLIGHPHRQLGDALVGVDHLLKGVAHQVALNRHKVLLHQPALSDAQSE